jgi:hypothetical protein
MFAFASKMFAIRSRDTATGVDDVSCDPLRAIARPLGFDPWKAKNRVRKSAKKLVPHITCGNGDQCYDRADDVFKNVIVVIVVRSLQFP